MTADQISVPAESDGAQSVVNCAWIQHWPIVRSHVTAISVPSLGLIGKLRIIEMVIPPKIETVEKQSHDSGFRPKLRVAPAVAIGLWQANHISALLLARGHEVEIETFTPPATRSPTLPSPWSVRRDVHQRDRRSSRAGRVDLAGIR